MSQRIEGRSIRVIIGAPGEDGFEVRDLRIVFKVKKDDGAAPNYAEVNIYNLTRQSAERTRQPNQVIQLFAGYDGVEHLIFLGALTRSTTTHEGTERITKLESGKATQAPKPVSRTFKGPQKLDGILGEVAGSIEGLIVDTSLVPDVSISKPRGVRLNGSPRQILNKYTAANKLDWYIDDGVLRFVPRGQPYNTTAVLLTPDSGLIGSPKAVQSGGGQAGRASVEIISTLNGRFTPRKIVALANTEDHAGWYLIRSVEHTGDLWGDFRSKLEASPIEQRSR